MRVFRSHVLCVLCALLGTACSSSDPAPVASDAADGGAESAADATDATDATEAATDATDDAADGGAGCTAKRTPAAAPTCGETCDVRLLLPGGDKYCTMTCAADKDCVPLGTGLVCSTTGTGTCVPACKTDTECKAAGFLRCDTGVGGCDTL
jgi:hypothetical protein